MINILVLAAQNQQNQTPNSNNIPFCLSEANGKTIIETIIEEVMPLEPHKYIYAFMKQDIDYWNLDCIVEQLTPGAHVIAVEKPTAGAACTALLCVSYIEPDQELLIVSVNELLRQDLFEVVEYFRKKQMDAGVMCFKSIHPRYAYVRANDEQMVIEAAERKPISQYALPGVFWFAKGRNFIEAAKNIIRKDAKVDERFYISSTLNELVLSQAKIGIFPIANELYIPLKTDKQIGYLETQNFKGVF